jgi:hypothetical protein
METLARIALIQQTTAVKAARWHPTQPGLLAFCCGTKAVYLWSKDHGCKVISLPRGKYQTQHVHRRPTNNIVYKSIRLFRS